MLQAIVLGAAQGLTEFVPVSSSAHLVLLPFLLRWRIPSLAFDVAIHLGTLVALLVYFAPDLLRMLAGATRAAVGRGNEGDRLQGRLVLLLAAGTGAAPGGHCGTAAGDGRADRVGRSRQPASSAGTAAGYGRGRLAGRRGHRPVPGAGHRAGDLPLGGHDLRRPVLGPDT